MDTWPPHVYRKKASELGRDDRTVENALAQARRLQSLGYPPILTLKHLSEVTESKWSFLRSVIGRVRDPYRAFQIRKRRGGYRIICVPSSDLMRIQRWISRNILMKGSLHPASVAYAKGCSPSSAAERHCGASWLVKVDIQGFFESISEIQVYRIFSTMGYGSLLAFELARICTRVAESPRRSKSRAWTSDARRIGAYNNRLIGHLPQGAPTSPMLANLAMQDLDAEIDKLSSQSGLVYTRYSDDLTFSTASRDFSRESASKFIAGIYTLLRHRGLQPHRAKTVIVPPGARRVVLGLLVDGPTPKLTRSFKDRMRQHLYYLRTLGPTVHATRRKFLTVTSMKHHLFGLASYASSIDARFGAELEGALNAVEWPPEL